MVFNDNTPVNSVVTGRSWKHSGVVIDNKQYGIKSAIIAVLFYYSKHSLQEKTYATLDTTTNRSVNARNNSVDTLNRCV